MIESLRTTQIAFFRFAMPSGFLGAETRYKKYSSKSPCKGKSYETTCENIVSWYQTLLSSLPRGTVFLHRRPKTELITGQPWKGEGPSKEFNSQKIGLGHQHGRRFSVLGHQYDRRDVMWKHSKLCLQIKLFPYEPCKSFCNARLPLSWWKSSQKLFLCWEPWFMSWTLPQNEIVVKCNLL